jgi:hypothetical protein
MYFNYSSERKKTPTSTEYLVLNFTNINFTTNYDALEDGQGVIILNNNFFNNELKADWKAGILNQALLSKKGIQLENCFIFDNKYAQKGRAFLLFIQSFSKEFFNVSTFLVLIIFCLFLKIHLTKTNVDYIKKIEFLDKNAYNDTLATPIFQKTFFFHYVLFYFSMIFALPTIYNIYFEFEYDNCLSFHPYSFDAFAYDRNFVENDIELNILVNEIEINVSKAQIYHYFLYFERNRSFTEKNANNNWRLILFLSSLIWCSRFYDVFSDSISGSVQPEKKKLTLMDKIVFSLSITFVIAYILFGFLFFIDSVTLLILYCSYDINRLKKTGNYVFLIIVMSHIILYTIIIIYSVRNKLEIYYRRKNRVFVINVKRPLVNMYQSPEKVRQKNSQFLGSVVNLDVEKRQSINDGEKKMEIFVTYFEEKLRKTSSLENNVNETSIKQGSDSYFENNGINSDK